MKLKSHIYKKPLLRIGSLLGLLMILFAYSCTNNSGSDFQVLEAQITEITAPQTAISDTDVKIRVDFRGPDGCSSAYNLKAEKVGQTITLRAYYKHLNDSPCTMALVSLTLEYSFFADLPGSYFFVSADDNAIADTTLIY